MLLIVFAKTREGGDKQEFLKSLFNVGQKLILIATC